MVYYWLEKNRQSARARNRNREMHTAQLTFQLRSKKAAEELVAERVSNLLFSLERNGQTIPNVTPQLIMKATCVVAIVAIPETASLRRVYFNKHVRRAMKQLADCLKLPIIKVLGRDPGSERVCSCRRPESLILSTDYCTSELPTSCGGCGGIVPFARFPHTDDFECYDNLIFWDRAYKQFDAIWMRSGAGEMLAYRELSRINSELNTRGREIAQRIEKLSGIAVYYYLYRHIGRRIVDEKRRRCPGCGGKWLLPQPWHPELWNKRFDFRCKKCRLLSNIAFDAT